MDFTKTSGTLNINDVMFVPDILLLVDYASHNEKVDVLMNMSKRVAYISTTDFDKSRAWLVEYAQFMHIDMFSESAYSVLTGQYLKELLAKSPANARATGDTGSIPGLARSPGGGNGSPLQYSCLENPMDRGVWQATVHGVTKSQHN